jgi:hypothetical protein
MSIDGQPMTPRILGSKNASVAEEIDVKFLRRVPQKKIHDHSSLFRKSPKHRAVSP